MIARVQRTWRCLAPYLTGAVFLCICLGILIWRHSMPLPFPTPARHELAVLVQPGPLTHDLTNPENPSGFENDLVESFARELGVSIRHVIAPPGDLSAQLKAHNVHLATAWLSPFQGSEYHFSPALLETGDVLVQPEASLPIEEISDLRGRTVHVLAASRQAKLMHALQKKISGLRVVELEKHTPPDLLEAVAARRHELAVVDAVQFRVALQFAPDLQSTLDLGNLQPIVWAFPKNANHELVDRACKFLERVRKSPEFARLQDRYFGHIHRLENADIRKFVELSKTRLPKLRSLFQNAQTVTGIDWRLLAALSYQESKWDTLATSPTGVRGIMMLTEDTADRLGISNRLDPEESILAGARYLSMLRNDIPEGTPEPDRTWMALAAYNIGPGHFRAGLSIGRQLKADTRVWHEMKRILPLLARPQYYERLRSGRARGGEAVILTENVRNYYDILKRHETTYLSGSIENLEGVSSLGLKIRATAKSQTGAIRSRPAM